MGIILDLLKEIPMSAILRERLVEQDKTLAEIPILKARIKEYEVEKEHLNSKILQLEEKIRILQKPQGGITPMRIINT
jgi:hypothetical protein